MQWHPQLLCQVHKLICPASPYEILIEDGMMHDVDQEDYDRWCEYILYKGLYRTSYARISRGSVTDTELQVAQFVLPKHGTTVVDDSFKARYRRATKETLPEEHVGNFRFFLGQLIHIAIVVPHGILRQQETGWCEWPFLPCIQHSSCLVPPDDYHCLICYYSLCTMNFQRERWCKTRSNGLVL